MLKWTETPSGAFAVLSVYGVELARLEVGSGKWSVAGRTGSKEGTASSLAFGKQAAALALEEILATALVDVRSAQRFSQRP